MALPKPGDTWYLDKVFLRINGKQHYLSRAIDQDGVVLDFLVLELAKRDCRQALLQAPAR